jgi:hypothetical protein
MHHRAFWLHTHRDKELIWSGAGDGLGSIAAGFHVCDYQGSTEEHLCFFQGVQTGEYARGFGTILDKHYQTVKNIQTSGGSDMHEFRLIEDGRRTLLTKYESRQYDLTGFNVSDGLGWISDNIFREIDLDTNAILFEWHSTNHILPGNGSIDPISSLRYNLTGYSKRKPYDYFHINSVDKNKDGDYLISSRHTNSIYKVSGTDGRILWRLTNSHHSHFELLNFSIWGQHDARWISVSHIISLQSH